MKSVIFLVPNECPICGNKTLQEWSCQTITMNGFTETVSTLQSYRCACGHVFTPVNSPTAA
jgi:hypothetical protein